MHEAHIYFIYLHILNAHAFYIRQKDSNVKCKNNESLLITNMNITTLENIMLLVKGLIFLCMFLIFPKILCFGIAIKKHALKCVWHKILSFYLKFLTNKWAIFFLAFEKASSISDKTSQSYLSHHLWHEWEKNDITSPNTSIILFWLLVVHNFVKHQFSNFPLWDN